MEAQMEHYLDNSATTQVLRPVAEKALELMVQEYGNPSSLHTKGFQARKQLEEARALVARAGWAPSRRRSSLPAAAQNPTIWPFLARSRPAGAWGIRSSPPRRSTTLC